MSAIDKTKIPFEALTFDEKVDRLLSIVERGKEKYFTDSTFKYSVIALCHGVEPIVLIDQLCSMVNTLENQLIKMSTVSPVSPIFISMDRATTDCMKAAIEGVGAKVYPTNNNQTKNTNT